MLRNEKHGEMLMFCEISLFQRLKDIENYVPVGEQLRTLKMEFFSAFPSNFDPERI